MIGAKIIFFKINFYTIDIDYVTIKSAKKKKIFI